MQCIFKNGEHTCPDQFPTQHVFYDEITGSRGCSACACAAPDWGECTAMVTLFQDGMCITQEIKVEVTSVEPKCIEVTGNPLGGKKVTAPSYLPGTCEPMGGEPIGSIERKGPSTFCCQQ